MPSEFRQRSPPSIPHIIAAASVSLFDTAQNAAAPDDHQDDEAAPTATLSLSARSTRTLIDLRN